MRAGHVSIIVGASRGIGQAVARVLAARGGNVIVVGRNPRRVAETVEILTELGPGRHIGRALDISSPGDMAEMEQVCRQHYGRVDLLVVSAVVAGFEEAASLPPQVRDLPLTAWRHAIDVNLHGVFLANRAVLPLMIEQGAGEILNIGSSLTPHGMKGRAHAAAYSATKFALAAFTRCLAAEVIEAGIRVNTVFPGTVETPLIEGTALASAFGGRIAVDNFADAIVRLLDFPADCKPSDPYILPLPRSG
jgi:2-hydroxycyclohexanecarboxyl-CoA dehydrogenase